MSGANVKIQVLVILFTYGLIYLEENKLLRLFNGTIVAQKCAKNKGLIMKSGMPSVQFLAHDAESFKKLQSKFGVHSQHDNDFKTLDQVVNPRFGTKVGESERSDARRAKVRNFQNKVQPERVKIVSQAHNVSSYHIFQWSKRVLFLHLQAENKIS